MSRRKVRKISNMSRKMNSGKSGTKNGAENETPVEFVQIHTKIQYIFLHFLFNYIKRMNL